MKNNKLCWVFHKALAMLLIITFMTAGGMFMPAPRAVEAASSYSLPSSAEQDEQAAALGMSTTQLPRYSPSGKEIDKTKSPLGSNLVVMNKIHQLAYSFTIAATDTMGTDFRYITNNPFSESSSQVNLNTIVQNGVTLPTTWLPYQQTTIGADTDGDGQQELITIGLVANGSSSRLQAVVTDYNKTQSNGLPQNSTVFTLDNSVSINKSSLTNTSRYIRAVAGDFDRDGKEEVAILVNSRVYVFALSMTASTRKFSNSYSAISDMEALDANKDGFADLLITINGQYTPNPALRVPAQLYIYSGGNYISPQIVPLNKGNAAYYNNTQIDMGNIFGTGEVVVVSSGLNLTWVQYNPVTEKYIAPQQFYSLYDEINKMPDMQAVKSGWDLKCASLSTPTPGTPEYVTTGGFIFLFDKNTQSFKLQEVTVTTDSDLDINSPDKSHNNITNVNMGKDETYIFEILVGNFDGNTNGKEQIILLHYNKWHRSEFLYLTGVRKTGNDLKVHMDQQWKKDSGGYYHATISAPYILDRGVKLEFLPERSTFAFSDPAIAAVIAAPPYYEELEYPTFGTWTIYGAGTETGGSESNSFNVEVGAHVGFSQGAGVFGVELLGIDMEARFTASMTHSWSESKSISKSVSFLNFATYDQVVVMVIPYDIYVYKTTAKDALGNLIEGELVAEVPYEPVMMMMPIDYYNQKAATMLSAPIIGPEVLKHTVGDPRTYPTTSTGLSNTPDKVVLLAGATEDSSFVSCGVGDGSIDQTIDSTDATDKGFDFGVSVEASYSVSVAGLRFGYHGGAGYTKSTTISSSKTTTRSGVVASVPLGYEQYLFNWALAVYNYELKVASGAKQTFPVVNYLVRADGDFPPHVPSNIRVDSQLLGENQITWDPSPGATGYRVLRSTSESVGYEELVDLTNGEIVSYSDSKDLLANQTYYYKVWAYTNAKKAIQSEPLPVTTLYVRDMTIATQPKLAYEEGEGLDLSAMVLSLNVSNGTTKQVPFAEFGTEVTASPAHSVALAAAQTGMPINVRHTQHNVSANTGSLIVNAKSPYDFGMSVTFKVGNTNNATALTANQSLQATVNLLNKSTTTQNVLVILALYSDKGNMAQMVHTSKSVASGAETTATLQLTLPGNVSGYNAKIFTWDGTSLTTTTLTPKAPTVRIPN